MNASNPKKQYGSEIDWKEAIGSNYYIISINKTNNSAPLIDMLPWHTDLECSILSNKYNPGQPIKKPGFWLFSRPF